MNRSFVMPRRSAWWVLAGSAGLCLLAVFWGDARGWLLAINTLWLATGTCAVSLPVGTVLALVLVRTDAPFRRTAGIFLAGLLFLPLYLQATAWQAGFGQQGWYTLAVGGWTAPPWLDGWRGAVWIHSLAAIPWVVLIVALGLRAVEPELEEEALLDGTAAQVFWSTTFRRMLGSVAAAGLWVAVATAGEMTVSDLWQLRTYAEEIYIGYALGETLTEAPLRVLPGMLLVGALVAAAAGACHHLVPPPGEPPARSPWRFRLGGARWPAAAALVAALLLLVAVPVGSLCYKAGVIVQQVGDVRVRTWSPAHFADSVGWAPWRYGRELAWSLAIGVPAAACSTALAAPLAWGARRGGWGAVVVLLVAAALLALPGPVTGLGLVELFSAAPGGADSPISRCLAWLYDRTLVPTWLATGARSLPVALLVLWHALRTVAIEPLDSAALEGAGPLVRLWRIALPQRRAALAIAFWAALAVAMGDLAASILVLPPGVDSLARRIWGLVHSGVDDQLAGLALATYGLFSLLAAAAITTFSRGYSQRG